MAKKTESKNDKVQAALNEISTAVKGVAQHQSVPHKAQAGLLGNVNRQQFVHNLFVIADAFAPFMPGLYGDIEKAAKDAASKLEFGDQKDQPAQDDSGEDEE